MQKILAYKYYILSCLGVILVGYLIYLALFMKAFEDTIFSKEVRFIGHGTYGIDNIDYTNSVESLKLGYDNGIRIMEVDFLFTSDGELVLNHYWKDGIIDTSVNFLNTKINNTYTTMSIDDLLSYMELYDDLYIIIDTKQNEYSSEQTTYDVYQEIVTKTYNYNEKLLDRFIIQLYNFTALAKVKKIYDFKHKIFTMYKLGEKINICSITYYCLFNDIDSIVIPYSHIKYNYLDEIDIKFIRSKNIKVYIHTINDMKIYNDLLEMGVNGVYTDFLK